MNLISLCWDNINNDLHKEHLEWISSQFHCMQDHSDPGSPTPKHLILHSMKKKTKVTVVWNNDGLLNDDSIFILITVPVITIPKLPAITEILGFSRFALISYTSLKLAFL